MKQPKNIARNRPEGSAKPSLRCPYCPRTCASGYELKQHKGTCRG